MLQDKYKLNPKQWLAIDAMAKGQSYDLAAVSAGVSRSTVARWNQKDAVFQEALEATTQEYRKSVHKDAIHAIRDSTDKMGKRIEAMADKMAFILEDWLSIKSAEEMKDNDVIRMMEVFSSYVDKSSAMRDRAWAVDELLNSLEEKE